MEGRIYQQPRASIVKRNLHIQTYFTFMYQNDREWLFLVCPACDLAKGFWCAADGDRTLDEMDIYLIQWCSPKGMLFYCRVLSSPALAESLGTNSFHLRKAVCNQLNWVLIGFVQLREKPNQNLIVMHEEQREGLRQCARVCVERGQQPELCSQPPLSLSL